MTNASTAEARADSITRASLATPRSETAKHRDLLAPFCEGYGIDVGFGGDPITPAALRMDLPRPYARTGQALPVQLGGDCRDLYWFGNGVLDYLYSSHVLEDFDREQTVPILREWARVVRSGGHLVLLQPDQVCYVAHCERRGMTPNAHHSIADFSLAYVKDVAERVGGLECAAEYPEIDDYSFAVVFRKTGSADAGSADAEGAGAAADAWRQRDELSRRVRMLESKIAGLEKSRALRLARAVRRLLGR